MRSWQSHLIFGAWFLISALTRLADATTRPLLILAALPFLPAALLHLHMAQRRREDPSYDDSFLDWVVGVLFAGSFAAFVIDDLLGGPGFLPLDSFLLALFVWLTFFTDNGRSNRDKVSKALGEKSRALRARLVAVQPAAGR